MTIQIAVRLPDELVEFVDGVVAAGRASSRAAVVTTALERELRLSLALQDAEILKQHGGYPDLEGMTDHLADANPGFD